MNDLMDDTEELRHKAAEFIKKFYEMKQSEDFDWMGEFSITVHLKDKRTYRATVEILED